MKKNYNYLFQPFHLVSKSPWPIMVSILIFNTMVFTLNWIYNFSMLLMNLNLLVMLLSLIQWWRDVIRESTFQGFHSKMVVAGLKISMILFIISEMLFFISIFWCYFHMYLSPSIEIGQIWPPKSIISFNPYSIPLLNTLILLLSGGSITWCHYCILLNKKDDANISLLVTIFLGSIFTLFQIFEYKEAYFSLSDSVYGSIFYMATGFHGLHVLIGTSFLMVNLYRLMNNNYSSFHHFGFEASAWYWHFVDLVWLFLFIFVYLVPYQC